MVVSSTYYFIELIMLLIVVAIGIVLLKNNKKKLGIVLCISLPIFLELVFFTFIFETPNMKINNIVNIEIGTNQKVEMPKTMYHFMDVTKDVEMIGKINYKKKGQYKVDFMVETLTGTYSKRITVNVEDTKKPEDPRKAKKKLTTN